MSTTISSNSTSALNTTRRDFLRVLGGGVVIAVSARTSLAQVPPPGGRGRGGGGGGGRRGGGGAQTVAARLHIGEDGVITVMTGKVECGQGARAELTQAAAEELRVAADRVRLVMADTPLRPRHARAAAGIRRSWLRSARANWRARWNEQCHRTRRRRRRLRHHARLPAPLPRRLVDLARQAVPRLSRLRVRPPRHAEALPGVRRGSKRERREAPEAGRV